MATDVRPLYQRTASGLREGSLRALAEPIVLDVALTPAVEPLVG